MLLGAGIFVAGLVAGYIIAAVTDFRIERKIDQRFIELKDDLRNLRN